MCTNVRTEPTFEPDTCPNAGGPRPEHLRQLDDDLLVGNDGIDGGRPARVAAGPLRLHDRYDASSSGSRNWLW